MNPQQIVTAFALCGAVAVALSGFVWIRKRRASRSGAALAGASVPVCVYVTLALAFALAEAKTSREPDNWDTARLTPSMALAQGQQVYSTVREGSVQTTMYPPMWVVSYLPVAIADTPSGVLRIGRILTMLFFLLPVALLLGHGSPGITLGVLGATSFFFISTSITSLSYSLFKPHADAPSFGYAMLACMLSLTGEPTARRLVGVALLAWFSVLAKQVMLPILGVLCLWYFIVHGRGVGARFASWLGLTGLGLMVLMIPFFGAEGVFFNTVIIPSRVPWSLDQYPPIIAPLLVAAELMIHSMPLVLLFTLTCGLAIAVRPPWSSGPGIRPFLAGNAWALPALVAVATVPASIMGRVKVGGFINTFSPTMYFLLAATILAAIGIPERLKYARNDSTLQLSLALLALCSLLLALGGAARIPFLASEFPVRADRSQQAYDYLRREDSRAYFPMHPLAHLLADGSAFHFAGALYDREELARLPLPARQRESHFPVEPSSVCWERGEEWVKGRYFTEYTRRVEAPALEPPWECYSR